MSIALDLETTGFDPLLDRIVSVGAVFYADDQETSTFYRLVDTEGRASNPGALAVHGIVSASGARTWGEKGGVGDQLEEWIRATGARVVLGHNIKGFDMRFLAQDPRWVKAGPDTYTLSGDLELTIRDTLVWARILMHSKQKKKQGDIAKALEIEQSVVSVHHNALEDARTCMKIAQHKLFRKHLISEL